MLVFNPNYGIADMYGKQYKNILQLMSFCTGGAFATSVSIYYKFITHFSLR